MVMELSETLLATLGKELLPHLIVFDLDYTLWPFWVDTHVCPPFIKDKHGKVVDKYNTSMDLYPQVLEIMRNLKKMDVKIAAASRTETPKEAKDFLRLIGIYHFFDHLEIYPGCKLAHFEKLRSSSEIEYGKMIFFDDEKRNIKDIRQLGVTCIHVCNGLDINCLEEGLRAFRAGSLGSF